MKIIRFETKTYLSTKEIEIQVNSSSYTVDVIVYGSWYVEEIKTLEEVLNYLREFNIPEEELLKIKEMIENV